MNNREMLFISSLVKFATRGDFLRRMLRNPATEEPLTRMVKATKSFAQKDPAHSTWEYLKGIGHPKARFATHPNKPSAWQQAGWLKQYQTSEGKVDYSIPGITNNFIRDQLGVLSKGVMPPKAMVSDTARIMRALRFRPMPPTLGTEVGKPRF